MERLVNFSFLLSLFPFFSPLMLKKGCIWTWKSTSTPPKHTMLKKHLFHPRTTQVRWEGCSSDDPSSVEKESSMARNSDAPGVIGAARNRMMKKMHSKLSAASCRRRSINWALSYFLARVGQQRIKPVRSLEALEVLRGGGKRLLLTPTSQGI